MKDLKLGIGGIILLLAGVLLFFATLNYFHVISLNKLYPDQFGWLPQRYADYKNLTAERLPKPQQVSKDKKTYAVNGFLVSRGDRNFTVSTSEGQMTFNLVNSATFLTVDTTKTPNKTKQYTNVDDFFRELKAGDLLLITYSLNGGINAEQVQHIVKK